MTFGDKRFIRNVLALRASPLASSRFRSVLPAFWRHFWTQPAIPTAQPVRSASNGQRFGPPPCQSSASDLKKSLMFLSVLGRKRTAGCRVLGLLVRESSPRLGRLCNGPMNFSAWRTKKRRASEGFNQYSRMVEGEHSHSSDIAETAEALFRTFWASSPPSVKKPTSPVAGDE